MNKPFISICIPTYKRADLLKKLLESIRIQTFTDFEILINDNSPDDTVKNLAATYSSLLPVEYKKNEPAISATENCNKVIGRANAGWIKIMHDDDWFATADALQQFADAAKQSGNNFIFCASNQVYLETGKIEPEFLTDERQQMLDNSFYSLIYLNVIGHPSVVMHKKDNSIEYDKQFNWVLDIDFYLRYLNAHGGYHYIPQALVNIGKGSTQESYKYYKNIKVEIPEYFALLTRYDSNLLLKNEYVFHLVWNMLKRFKIKSIADLSKTGYTGRLPERIEEIINYQKNVPAIILKQPRWSKVFMKKSFRKITMV
jgi:glycosyltransferase involved in cell wall biosynthesis